MSISLNKSLLIAYLAIFIISSAFASKSSDPLERFHYVKGSKFLTNVNVGLYFDEPRTLNVQLENDPSAPHDGSLPFFFGSFNDAEELLTSYFGSFMFHITKGKDKDILNELTSQDNVSDNPESKHTEILSLDIKEIMGCLLQKGITFDRLYATGHQRGLVRLSIISRPDLEPSEHWISYPHPTLKAKRVGMQIMRTLISQAQAEQAENIHSNHYG